MAANITHQGQADLRKAAQRAPQRRFLCPNCLNFGEFRYACGYCWEEVKISRWFSANLENKKCPHCKESFSPPAELPWYGLLAQCEHCQKKFDRTIYHHREVRVLGTFQSIDFARLCQAVIGQETKLQGSRGHIFDDGAQLTYLLDLSVLTDPALSLPYASALGEVEAVWLDAVEDDSPPWDFELIKMADRFIAQSGMQSELKVCVSRPDLNEVVKNALSARFGMIKHEIAAADFFSARTNVTARGEVGPKSTVPALCGKLKYGDKYDRRENAAEVLGAIGDAQAVEPLCAALKDFEYKDEDNWPKYGRHWPVRQAAAAALLKIGTVEALCAALKSEDGSVRRTAEAALVKIGQFAVKPLCAALKDEDRDLRRAAAEALRAIGDAWAVEPLCAALKDEDSDVRRTAAEALGAIGDARAVEPLCAALKDGSWPVRQAAAAALGAIGDVRAVEPLCAALKDCDRNVRQAAAAALGAIGDARAVEALCAALGDWNVRQVAAAVLVKIGQPAVKPLCAALKDGNSSMRQAAAEVLGSIGDARAVRALRKAFKKDDYGIRQVAAEALKKIHYSAPAPSLWKRLAANIARILSACFASLFTS